MKRYTPKDDLWASREFVAHLLARKVAVELRRFKKGGGRPLEGVCALSAELPIPEDVIALCAIDPKAAVPELIEAICKEKIEAKALKRHKRLFFQLRPWLLKNADPDYGIDRDWSAPQAAPGLRPASYFWLPDDYTRAPDRYFQTLIRLFLKKAPKPTE